MTNRTFPKPIECPTLSVTEAGDFLGLGRDAAYRGVRSGEIPSIRVGRRIVVPTARLAQLLGLGEER